MSVGRRQVLTGVGIAAAFSVTGSASACAPYRPSSRQEAVERFLNSVWNQEFDAAKAFLDDATELSFFEVSSSKTIAGPTEIVAFFDTLFGAEKYGTANGGFKDRGQGDSIDLISLPEGPWVEVFVAKNYRVKQTPQRYGGGCEEDIDSLSIGFAGVPINTIIVRRNRLPENQKKSYANG